MTSRLDAAGSGPQGAGLAIASMQILRRPGRLEPDGQFI